MPSNHCDLDYVLECMYYTVTRIDKTQKTKLTQRFRHKFDSGVRMFSKLGVRMFGVRMFHQMSGCLAWCQDVPVGLS